MRPQLPENALVNLLRQCYLTPKCQSQSRSLRAASTFHTRSFRTSAGSRIQHRDDIEGPFCRPIEVFEPESLGEFVVKAASTSQSPNSSAKQPAPQRNVAILGGGITGLTSAFYLSKELPDAKITVYEGSNRLGGWLQTKHVNVGNGDIVFEQGPRTLRPNPPAGMVTLNLIKLLDLEDEVIITTKNSVAAQNRFIYYPDHLVRMPAPGEDLFQQIWSVLTEPVFNGLIRGAWNESKVPKRPSNVEDESVGDFLTRRLGTSAVADNMVSAVLHGIYAGDIYQLSARSLQPKFWAYEAAHGSVYDGFFANRSQRGETMEYRDAALMQEMTNSPDQMARSKEMSFASVYSFKKGIQQLSDSLVECLRKNPNIAIKTESGVKSLAYNGKDNNVQVTTTTDNNPITHDQVISTISARHLTSIVPKDTMPSLKGHSVTVMVVNLYYRDQNIMPVHGFGYLIPRSIPFEQNPEMALGVVFDSDASIGQDSAAGTKLTVMMGGHWWDNFQSYPDEEQGAAMAKAVLMRHLKIDIEPEFVHVALQRECIPQYTVGHDNRMKTAHYDIMNAFNGKLTVAGNSYTGVGLNDCVRAARDVSLDVAGHEGPAGVSGLEQFTTDRRWVKALMATA